ncbi:ABC transporter substrate-binding protein [Leifsonia sp. YAF41]|uniref:ABC transporter substrate-binding protein n=1 Tax=Leifsonia sp. YAF41 TaxID=3233086 RepID=UPI003F9C6738
MSLTQQQLPTHRKIRSHRRRIPRATAVLTVAVVTTLTFAACTPATTPPPKAVDFELTAATPAATTQIDSFTWSIYAEPSTLDYARAFDYPDNQVLSNVCESLLRWNADLSVSPGLAEKWENPTPTTWVYTIRPGVTFHDGSPLTAADVVASLNRHLDPEVGSPWSGTFKNVLSIEQTGDLQVTVTTSVHDSQFNLAMASGPGTVESAATLAADGADYGNAKTGVNCTGPFSFAKWDSGSSITLDRYDAYWDKDLLAKSAHVEFVFLSDPNARINAFNSGEVDGGWMVPTNAVESLAASKTGKFYFGVNSSVTSEVVSDLTGPLGDVRVRKAMMMAIDRNGLVAAAEHGYATPTTALTNRSVWSGSGQTATDQAFDGLNPYPLDLTAAKKLVTDAGATGKEIVIATASVSAGETVIAQAVAAAATSIGLKPTINTLSNDKYSTLFTDADARKGIDMFLVFWNLSKADPLEMFSILQTDDYSNYGGWSNPEFDDIVTHAISVADPAERAVESAKAQHIVNEELPWLPLFTSPTTLWLSSRITGVAPSVNYLYYPWAATIGGK